MNKLLIAAALAAPLLAGMPAHAADVGVSISISQPGVYGRIDIGQFPQPGLIGPRPVIIGRPAVVAPQPIYMWVPPEHRLNWARYCARYHACDAPVYFVRDDWYGSHVRPHAHDHDRGRGYERDDRGRDRGRGHDDHDDHDHNRR